MKASAVASVVSALLATDAKPTEAAILAAIIAADKKAKDEGGLGPVEIQNKKAGDKAKDAFPEKDDKAEDEKDDKAEDEKDDDKAKDADMDDVDAEDDAETVQPKKSAGGNSGNGEGKKPAMDAAIKLALDERDALHAARRAVESVIGVVTYDSAAEVYAAALKKLGVAVDGIDASAYPALFKLARDKQDAVTPVMASDAAAVKTMSSVIKGYDRLR